MKALVLAAGLAAAMPQRPRPLAADLGVAAQAQAQASPWNGRWVLSSARNTPEIKAQAADDYAFTLQPDGRIRWEIPSLKEVVEGRTDGRPMTVRRAGVDSGSTLSVTAEGPRVLLYAVSRHGAPEGQGRMTLVENGQAWVDLSWPAGKPQFAGVVVYVRSGAG